MSSLCLLTVHAHPDDESSKGAGTVAHYSAEGVHSVLVTCTGGEVGEILNPAMDQPGIRERLGEVRKLELEQAAQIIGYDEVVWLGYRDSGMPGTPDNEDPRSFAQAPLDEAVERLVRVIRRVKPQVIITYPEDQSGYPHPDHLRVHEISVVAFDAAGDPERYPGSGEAWQPLKLYTTSWSLKRVLAIHDKFLELGLESPFNAEWFTRRGDNDDKADPAQAEAELRRQAESASATTAIDVSGFGHIRDLALKAHATQVDPTSKFWFGLPEEVSAGLYPIEEYNLERSLVETAMPEDDLFEGVRELVSR
jgi:mycothiol S-conjugate amidase